MSHNTSVCMHELCDVVYVQKTLRVSICNCADVAKKWLFLTVRMSPFLACSGRLSIVRPLRTVSSHFTSFSSSGGENLTTSFYFEIIAGLVKESTEFAPDITFTLSTWCLWLHIFHVNLCHSLQMSFPRLIFRYPSNWDWLMFLLFLFDCIILKTHAIYILLDLIILILKCNMMARIKCGSSQLNACG